MEIGDITILAGFALNLPELSAKLAQAEQMARVEFKPVPVRFDFTPPTALTAQFRAEMASLTAGVRTQTVEVAALVAEYRALGAVTQASGLNAPPAASQRRGAAMNTEATYARMLGNEVRALGNDYRTERTGIDEAAQGMKRYGSQAQINMDLIEQRIAVLKAQSARNTSEVRELADLTAIYSTYSGILKTTVVAQEGMAKAPLTASLQAQRAAMNEVRGASAALNQEIVNGRRAFQEGKIDSTQLAEVMTSLGIRANALLAPLQAQKQAILDLGVPTKEEALTLERLEGQITGFSQAAQRAAAGVDLAFGRLTPGSIGASVSAGVRDAANAVTLLNNQYKAGTINATEYTDALKLQRSSLLSNLTAVQTEAAGLRELGMLSAQDASRLAVLVAEEQRLTGAAGQATTAIERQAAAQRAAMGAGLGIRGAGGMTNAAMAASFISPELGALSMAATMGPWVAGAAAVGLFTKAIGDGIDKAAVFQRSLTQIGAISGQTTDQMNVYGTSIQRLSTELPISTQKLAEMSREAVMVGLHGQEGMGIYMNTMAAFAIVTRDANGELGHTAEVGQEVVKILRSTGATTEDVTVGFGRMINGLIGLKTESGLAIPQVTKLLSFWSAQGHSVGLTIEQMTGLSAALVQTGAQAQGSGSAMATFYRKASAAAADGGPQLDAWAKVIGKSSDATKDLLKTDPMAFLMAFVNGAKAAEDKGTDLSLTLGSVGLKSAQVQRAMHDLNNAIPLVTDDIKIMTDASNDQGLALRKAMDATNDYKDKLDLISHAWDNIKTNMAIAVLPGMTAVAAWALDFSTNLMNASNALDNILKATGQMQGKPTDTTGLMPYNKNTVNLDGLSPAQVTKANDLMAQITNLVAKQAGSQELAGRLSGIPWVGDYLKVLAGGGIDETKGELGKLTAELHDLVATAKKQPFIGPLNNQQQYLAGTQPRGFTQDKAGIIAKAAKDLGVSPNDLAQIIAAETGGTFDPSTPNQAGSGGTGLIQFMPSTAKTLGTTTAALANMSFEQQMDYVVKYFKARPDFKPGANLGDLYSAVSGSGYKRGSKAYEANQAWDTNGDGVIERGEAVKSEWFKSFAANYFPAQKSGADGSDGLSKGAAAYLAEAQRIQDAIDKAQKQGGAAGLTAYTAARHELELFTKGNKDAADAVAYLGTQTKEAAKVQTEATKDAAQIRKALSQGNVTDAETTLEKLKTIQQAQLDNAGDSQAKRLAVVKQTSQQIHDAEIAIATATKNAAYANVADEKNLQVKAQQQTLADKQFALASQKADLAQAQAITTAQKAADTEADKAQKDHDKAVKDAAKARADTIKALREDDVKGAEASLAKLNEVRDREIATAKNDVVKQVAIAKDYAAQTYQLQLQINKAKYDQTVSEANNGRAQEKPKLLATAQTTLDADNLAARNKQTETVTTATDKQTEAIRTLRTAYSAIADTLREGIKDGGLDAEARQKVVKALNDQHDAALKLGILDDKNIVSSRNSVRALLAQSDTIHGGLDGINAAVTLTDSLLDNLDAHIADMKEDEQTVLELRQAAMGQGIDPNSAAPTDNRDLTPTPRPDAGASDYLKLLGLAPDAFAALASSTIPTAMQEATTPEQYAGLGVDILRGLVDGLGDKAGWEKVRDAMQTGLNQAMETQSLVVQAPVVPGINTGNLRADDVGFGQQAGPETVTAWQKNLDQLAVDKTISGLKDLSDEGVQALADFGASLKDDQGIKIYNAALTELQKRADDAKKALLALPADKIQIQLNQLDRQHATTDSAGIPGIDDLQYANERERLQTELENAKYKALEHATENDRIAHEDRLTQIKADGEAARQAITDRYMANATKDDAVQSRSEKTLESTQQSFDELIASYKEGSISVSEFSAQALALLPKLEALAKAAEANGDADLASIYRAAAAGLAGMIPPAQKLLSELDLLAGGAEKLGQGFASIFDGFGMSDWGKISSSLGSIPKLLKSGMDAVEDFQRSWTKFSGDKTLGNLGGLLGSIGGIAGVAGAAINLIGSLGDAILNLSPGFQKWKSDLIAISDLEKKAIGGAGTSGIKSPWQDALEQDAANREKLANAGFWQRLAWGLFGGAPEVMKTEAANLQSQLQTIFNGLADGIANDFTSSMTDAFTKGTMSDWAANFDKEFDATVGKVILSTLITAALQTGAVANDLADLTKAVQAGDYNAIPAILTRVKGDAHTALAPIASLAPSLPGYGADAATGITSPGLGTYLSDTSSVQFGVPSLELKWSDSAIAGLRAVFDPPIAAFGGHVDRFGSYIDRLGGGATSGPPPRSPQGNLV